MAFQQGHGFLRVFYWLLLGVRVWERLASLMPFWLCLGLGLTRKTELHDTAFESLKAWCVFARLPLPVIADCALCGGQRSV